MPSFCRMEGKLIFGKVGCTGQRQAIALTLLLPPILPLGSDQPHPVRAPAVLHSNRTPLRRQHLPPRLCALIPCWSARPAPGSSAQLIGGSLIVNEMPTPGSPPTSVLLRQPSIVHLPRQRFAFSERPGRVPGASWFPVHKFSAAQTWLRVLYLF